MKNISDMDNFSKMPTTIDRKALEEFLKTYHPKQPKAIAKQVRTYKTAWYFYNPAEIDKQVFDMIQNFLSNTRAFRNKQLWSNYAALLYLSGARSVELFLKPPSLNKLIKNDKTYYQIHHINAKHFNDKRKREIIDIPFRAFNVYEDGLFQYLMQGRQTMKFDFTPLLSAANMRAFAKEDPEHTDSASLRKIMTTVTKRFNQMFKADITNGDIRHEHGNVTPHMLRHIRAYDLWINEGMKPQFVQKVFGWKRLSMLEYYADLSRAMQTKEMLAELERIEAEKRK